MEAERKGSQGAFSFLIWVTGCMVVPFAGKENIGASWEAGDGGFCVEPVELKCC